MSLDSMLHITSKLLFNPPEEYDKTVEVLKGILKLSSLVPDKNPVLNSLDGIFESHPDFLKYIIVEYSAFSNQAIHMLLDARIRNHDWDKLREEIQHNIEEEWGMKTKGIPHLEIMRQGYREELGIETDNQNISLTTTSFLERMGNIFRSDDNAFAAGALLAFEGTAIPEFYILDQIVTYHNGKKAPSKLTKYYIDGHKYFEIGHEEGLRSSIKPYINKSNMSNFIKGYVSVVLCMSNWWDQLYFKYEFRKLSEFGLQITHFDTAKHLGH